MGEGAKASRPRDKSVTCFLGTGSWVTGHVHCVLLHGEVISHHGEVILLQSSIAKQLSSTARDTNVATTCEIALQHEQQCGSPVNMTQLQKLPVHVHVLH